MSVINEEVIFNVGPEEHGYCVVPRAERLGILYSLLMSLRRKKVMVVFSSCNSVKFHAKLLRYIHIDCVDIHGRLKKQTEESRFSEFSRMDKGILLCTEIQAHRNFAGITADWIVQYDPPDGVELYVRRVESMKGEKSVIFLDPEELGFVGYLKKTMKAPVVVFGFDRARIADVQPHLEVMVSDNEDLRKSARDAFGSFVLAYKSNCTKAVFDVQKLDVKAVSASFCKSSGWRLKTN